MHLLPSDVHPAQYQARFVCSDCWEPLVVDLATDQVTCSTPGCACRGASELRSVIRRESSSLADLRQAEESLLSVAALPGRVKPKLTEAQILSDLGFGG